MKYEATTYQPQMKIDAYCPILTSMVIPVFTVIRVFELYFYLKNISNRSIRVSNAIIHIT